jgi:hypothetical protein
MRIPSSAIIMSLVAAVPFGLAIRDTLEHREPRDVRMRQLLADQARERADADEELAQEHAHEHELALRDAERDKQRHDNARQLVGAGFVTPGPAFGALALGAPPMDVGNDPTTAATFVVAPHAKLLSMSRDVADDDPGCSALVDVASSTWGEPSHDHVWLDLGTHRRASIDADCSLTFAQFEEPAAWVAHLPLDVIGRSRGELAKRYLAPDNDPDSAWHAPGLDGDDLTTLSPIYDVDHPDKLLGVEIVTAATPQTFERAVQALATRIGAKPTRDTDGVYHWKTAHAELADGRLLLVLGVDQP